MNVIEGTGSGSTISYSIFVFQVHQNTIKYPYNFIQHKFWHTMPIGTLYSFVYNVLTLFKELRPTNGSLSANFPFGI